MISNLKLCLKSCASKKVSRKIESFVKFIVACGIIYLVLLINPIISNNPKFDVRAKGSVFRAKNFIIFIWLL